MNSFEQHELISKIAKSVAAKRGIGESEHGEEINLSNFLPQHHFAKSIVTDILYRDEKGIKTSLVFLFQQADARSNVPDLRPFIGFAQQQELQNRVELTGTEPVLPHLIKQAKNIINHLAKQNKKQTSFDDIFLGKSLINDLENSPSSCIIYNFYNIIIRNWEDLNELSSTYRLLADLVQVSNPWDENQEKQADLLTMFIEESKKWPENAFS